MEVLSKKITNIEEKVKLLGEELISLRAENKRLRQDQKQFENSLFGAQNKAKENAAAVKTGNAKDSAAIKKLKKEIDQYVKEIDKCIEWLQKS